MEMEDRGVVKILMHQERECYRTAVTCASAILRKRNHRRATTWMFFIGLFLTGTICTTIAIYEYPKAMYVIQVASVTSMVLLLAYNSCCTKSAKPWLRRLHLPILDYCNKYRFRGMYVWYAFALLLYIVFSSLFLYRHEELLVYGLLGMSVIGLVAGVICLPIFLLLAKHLHHRGRGDPYFDHRSLEPLLGCCCSAFTSIEKFLPKRARENTEPFVHYIANVGDEIPNQDVRIARASDYLEIQMEGFENPPIEGLEEVPEEEVEEIAAFILLEVMVEISAGLCFELMYLSKRSLTSYPFSNEASNSDLLSTPTDSIPNSFTRGSSTSSQVTVLAAGSQSDIDDPFSDENPQQGTSERLGGEQACSSCETSEEVSQIEQDTSACQSSEEMALPRQVEKAEMVESSSEELPK